MNRSILARIVLAATAVALVPLQQPEAYTLKSAKWSTLTVPYYVNPGNFDVSPQAAVDAMQAGALGWTAQSRTPFRFAFAGLTSSTTASNNGRNEVFFRDASNGSAVATTYSWYSGSTNARRRHRVLGCARSPSSQGRRVAAADCTSRTSPPTSSATRSGWGTRRQAMPRCTRAARTAAGSSEARV